MHFCTFSFDRGRTKVPRKRTNSRAPGPAVAAQAGRTVSAGPLKLSPERCAGMGHWPPRPEECRDHPGTRGPKGSFRSKAPFLRRREEAKCRHHLALSIGLESIVADCCGPRFPEANTAFADWLASPVPRRPAQRGKPSSLPAAAATWVLCALLGGSGDAGPGKTQGLACAA